MQFNTDIYYKNTMFGGYVHAHWKLWFIEIDRQHMVVFHTLSAKPTKKQIRKLRRKFRKEALHEHH